MSVNKVFGTNIEVDTVNNDFFRKVISTTKNQQLVLMSLKPKEDIDFEIHNENDQFIRVEKGQGVALIGKNRECKYDLIDGSIIVIPAGTWHQIINMSDTDELKLYTIYSPPHHPSNRIDKTKPRKDQEGGNYHSKYLKYKSKYLELKKM